MSEHYICLQETNDEERETWMNFIKYEGNEDAIKYLSDQLESVNFYLLPDSSTFDIDMKHLVDASTAKQITKLELNSCFWHRKFDGKLKMIDFGFEKIEQKCVKKNKTTEYCNEKKMEKIYDIIGYGNISDFIDGEDIDEENRDKFSSSSFSSSSEEDEEDEKKEKKEEKKIKIIPLIPSRFQKHETKKS